MHEWLDPGLLRRKHLSRQHVVLSIGLTASQQIIIGHVEESSLVATEVIAARWVRAAVTFNTVFIHDGLDELDENNNAVIAPVRLV